MAIDRRLPDPATEPVITVPRAADVVQVGLRTAYDRVEAGDWPAIRVGRAIRIPTARWLAALGLTAPDRLSDGDPVAAGHGAASHANVTARGAG